MQLHRGKRLQRQAGLGFDGRGRSDAEVFADAGKINQMAVAIAKRIQHVYRRPQRDFQTGIAFGFVGRFAA